MSLAAIGNQLRAECVAVGIAQADVVLALTNGGNGLEACLVESVMGYARRALSLPYSKESGPCGTATFGNDYAQAGAASFTATAGTVTFAAGAATKTETVNPTSDTMDEPNELVVLTVIGGTDNNQPPSLSINDAPAATEPSFGTVTATLSAASGFTVTVDYATAAVSADYQSAAGTLTFAPGETTKFITVFVEADTLAESTETFVMNLSNAINALFADAQGFGTILDND